MALNEQSKLQTLQQQPRDGNLDLATPALAPLYSPLPPDTIRVLYLEDLCLIDSPSNTNKELSIQCCLENLSLRDVTSGKASYTALSYVWGIETRLCCNYVKCNGQVIPVTMNLFQALHQLRYDPSVQRVWVDALCVNQDDPLEKAAQIALMGDIYRQADFVIAWLGPLSVEDGAAQAELWRKVESQGATISDSGRSAIVDHVQNCKWMTRAWTLQEIVLAKEARLQYGPFQVKWNLISGDLDLANDSSIKVIESLRAKQDRSRLVELLWAGMERHCQRPEDKIYSLLGMYKGGMILPSVPLTTEEVFAQASLVVIEEAGYLFFVHNFPAFPGHTRIPHGQWERYTPFPRNTVFRGNYVPDEFRVRQSWVTNWSEKGILRENDTALPNSDNSPSWSALRPPELYAHLFKAPFLNGTGLCVPGAILGFWVGLQNGAYWYQEPPAHVLGDRPQRFAGVAPFLHTPEHADSSHNKKTAQKTDTDSSGANARPVAQARKPLNPVIPDALKSPTGAYSSGKLVASVWAHFKENGWIGEDRTATHPVEQHHEMYLFCVLFGYSDVVVLRPELDSKGENSKCWLLQRMEDESGWSRALDMVLQRPQRWRHYSITNLDTAYLCLDEMHWLPTHFELL